MACSLYTDKEITKDFIGTGSSKASALLGASRACNSALGSGLDAAVTATPAPSRGGPAAPSPSPGKGAQGLINYIN